MEINKIVDDSVFSCLLCLEPRQEFVNTIFISSAQYNRLDIKFLIEKYLWTMKHITPYSRLCANCWKQLYDFHNFYMRIEKAHESLELHSEKTHYESAVERCKSGFKESPMEILLDCSFDGLNEIDNLTKTEYNNGIENHIIEFKEGKTDLSSDCPASQVNCDKPSNECNPLLDAEIHLPLVDTFSLEQESNLNEPYHITADNRRTRRINYCHSADYLKDSINKINRSKQIISKTIKNKIKSKPRENVSGADNLVTEQKSHLLSKSETEQFAPASTTESKRGTDPESLLATEKTLFKKPNFQTKAIIPNPKDKFLAENFKIKCCLCDIPFETFCSVQKHFKEQHKERGYIQCCDKKFYRRNVLIDHVNYHLNSNYFKCNQCDRVMEDRRRLELHCKTHEINNGKNFCCQTCGKGFLKLAFLKAHTKIHLSDEEKLYSCLECGKKFASNYMLTNHCRASHLKMYHKICEICGKSIQDKTIFERHMLQHQGKVAPSASCDICGLLLTDEKALERHKKVIHPENGQKKYTCSICNKITSNLRNHKLHVRFTHESGYNYKCTICDKTFKRAQPLKEHMASHTGEILYTCPWCPKTFNSNANMHNHRKKVHPKEWVENSRKRYSGKLPPRFKPPATIEIVKP